MLTGRVKEDWGVNPPSRRRHSASPELIYVKRVAKSSALIPSVVLPLPAGEGSRGRVSGSVHWRRQPSAQGRYPDTPGTMMKSQGSGYGPHVDHELFMTHLHTPFIYSPPATVGPRRVTRLLKDVFNVDGAERGSKVPLTAHAFLGVWGVSAFFAKSGLSACPRASLLRARSVGAATRAAAGSGARGDRRRSFRPPTAR